MWSFLRDTVRTWSLRARYRRIVQEQLLHLVEGAPQPVSEEPGDWLLVGGGSGLDGRDRVDARNRARQLAVQNPHVRNMLRLLEIYVVGPGLKLTHAPTRPEMDTEATADRADRLWEEFLQANRRHYSFREHARRTWRDGEAFVRFFAQAGWPPAVRFADPETIDAPAGDAGSEGIITAPHDVETVLAYQRIDPVRRALAEEIPADEMLHTKYGCDSNQKRGVSVLLPILDSLKRFEGWLDAELQARKLQASIVLWRKVQGGPASAAGLADAASGGAMARDAGAAARAERVRPGTIVTTSRGTELQFLQPNTNFGDAVPLGRMLLLCVAAGQGIPEFMLTSDASNANYASTMVAEGPAVKMFQSEQQFFIGEFTELWRWVMGEAVRLGRLPATIWDRLRPEWSAPQLVTRDRPRERLADVRLVEQGVLSRAEVSRREGVDPALMRAERARELQAMPQGVET